MFAFPRGVHNWTPLWNGIVDSSLWDEPDHVVKVFLTMLAIKDYDFVVRKNTYGLARAARKTEEEVMDALRVLSSPDKRRIEKQPFQGRRIKAVADGWFIINGENYRKKVSEEMKKERNRRAQANFRAKRDGKALPYPKVSVARQAQRDATEEEQRALYQAHEDVRDSVKHLDQLQTALEVGEPLPGDE